MYVPSSGRLAGATCVRVTIDLRWPIGYGRTDGRTDGEKAAAAVASSLCVPNFNNARCVAVAARLLQPGIKIYPPATRRTDGRSPTYH